jgi:hypothetical protein
MSWRDSGEHKRGEADADEQAVRKEHRDHGETSLRAIGEA